MDCNEARQFIEADIDGELDLVRHLELGAHLAACPACSAVAAAASARRKALRGSLPRFSAPTLLVEKIRASMSEEHPKQLEISSKASVAWPMWNVVGLAAMLAIALIGGYSLGSARSARSALLGEIVSDHVRSLQGGHLMDVVSTDQHTVKPWFVGKLDFSPPVVDLADAGYPLIGGRLDHVAGRNAAALIFRRHLHTINLLIWPAESGAVSPGQGRLNGFNTLSWSRDGLDFTAVSEIPAEDLGGFADAFQARTK